MCSVIHKQFISVLADIIINYLVLTNEILLDIISDSEKYDGKVHHNNLIEFINLTYQCYNGECYQIEADHNPILKYSSVYYKKNPTHKSLYLLYPRKRYFFNDKIKQTFIYSYDSNSKSSSWFRANEWTNSKNERCKKCNNILRQYVHISEEPELKYLLYYHFIECELELFNLTKNDLIMCQ